MAKTPQCELCEELRNDEAGKGSWAGLPAGRSATRVVAENDEYVAVVSVGPIVRGHCLIVPRAHQLSMSSGCKSDRCSLTALTDVMVDRMRAIYGEHPLLFEHGASEGSCFRPCSVAHAHWHLLPSSLRPEELLVDGYPWVRQDEPWVAGRGEYLLVGSPIGGYWLSRPQTPITSQVLRRLIAERTGNERHWDWRVEPAVDLMVATVEDFNGARCA